MISSIEEGATAEELPLVQAGILPERYGQQMQAELSRRLQPLLTPAISVLDVGAGRHPTLPRDRRPPDCRYVGFDIAPDELAAAGADAYDETIVGDVTRPLQRDGEFDIALSWQVLEHVSPLADAFENLRNALRPGGVLLAQLTGSNAVFARVGRLMPHRARAFAASRLLGHEPEEKFPTRYDRSTQDALERMLDPWSSVEIVPFFRGATYFTFFRPALRLYLAYESAVARREKKNLATHYLVVATR